MMVPYHFNTRENQNYVGPYPEATYYGHDFMDEKERNELLEWLSERKDKVFDFSVPFGRHSGCSMSI